MLKKIPPLKKEATERNKKISFRAIFFFTILFGIITLLLYINILQPHLDSKDWIEVEAVVEESSVLCPIKVFLSPCFCLLGEG